MVDKQPRNARVGVVLSGQARLRSSISITSSASTLSSRSRIPNGNITLALATAPSVDLLNVTLKQLASLTLLKPPASYSGTIMDTSANAAIGTIEVVLP